MKTLFLDCSMGAAGDMLTAALLALTDDPSFCVKELNHLDLPGIHYELVRTEKCGISCMQMKVTYQGVEETEEMHSHAGEPHEGHHHHHEHSSLGGIRHIVKDHMHAPEKVKNDVIAVYEKIAAAESAVHGTPVSEIHFHEVGSMDAVADVAAVCWLMNRLNPEKTVASAINTGSGHVKCAHGILPVPAPATAFLLKDIPCYSSGIRSELCTPTGAALIGYFADSFGEMPVMRLRKSGYGAGKKDFETANVVGAYLGESSERGDVIAELSCNIDDMTAEEISYAMEVFFAHGAREVYTVPVGMKKSRPGILLSVMCSEDKRDEMLKLIFRHTTTLGVRENISQRYTMKREIGEVKLPCGKVHYKKSSGYGTERVKCEYEDLAAAARKTGESIAEIREQAMKKLRAEYGSAEEKN